MDVTTDPRFLAGCQAWNAGRFFEAHEHWEALWLTLRKTERLWLQGLIQLAASNVKAERGEAAGAVSLRAKGLRNAQSPQAPEGLADWLEAFAAHTPHPLPWA